jgi:hypothetical protein
MSLNRLLTVFNNTIIKKNTILNLNRYISSSNNLRIRFDKNLLSSHSSVTPTKSEIDHKLIAKLSAEDPLTDKSELDKPEWERKNKNVKFFLMLNLLLINKVFFFILESLLRF